MPKTYDNTKLVFIWFSLILIFLNHIWHLGGFKIQKLQLKTRSVSQQMYSCSILSSKTSIVKQSDFCHIRINSSVHKCIKTHYIKNLIKVLLHSNRASTEFFKIYSFLNHCHLDIFSPFWLRFSHFNYKGASVKLFIVRKFI